MPPRSGKYLTRFSTVTSGLPPCLAFTSEGDSAISGRRSLGGFLARLRRGGLGARLELVAVEEAGGLVVCALVHQGGEGGRALVEGVRAARCEEAAGREVEGVRHGPLDHVQALALGAGAGDGGEQA